MTEVDLQSAAQEHLWLHFTRMDGYRDAEVPMIVCRDGCCDAQLSATLAKPHGCAQTRVNRPPHVHGKEGVDGSSPSEGSAQSPAKRGFLFRMELHLLQFDAGMEHFMEVPDSKRRPTAG